MIRRQFLQLVLALGGLGWAERSSTAHAVAERCTIGRELVDELETLAQQLAARWDDGHPALLHRQLLGLYGVLAHLAEDATPMYAMDLAQLAGRSAALVGLVCRFLDRDTQAGVYLLAANRWALEAQDRGLQALAAVWRSDIHSAVQAGRPGPSPAFVGDQLELAEQCAGTTAPPAVRALVALRQAEEYAAAGDVDTAMRRLDRADAAWAAPEGCEIGLYGLPWPGGVIHDAFRANVAVLSGRPDAALPILSSVVEASVGSNHVAATTDLAAALAQLGEVEESAALLARAWTDAHAAGLADRMRRIRGVRLRDLDHWSAEPAVRQLDEALAAGA